MQLLGISTDSVESHKRFCDSLKLPFPLLADVKGAVSRQYGILITRPNGALLSGRSVFLIDSEGVVRYADSEYKLRPKDDHDALLMAVRKFKAGPPKIEGLKFGAVHVNGRQYDTDVIIDRGDVRTRDKGPSRDEKRKYGHTPLTVREAIPWDCDTLVLGIGMHGRLPVVDEFVAEARRRGVKLVLLKTPEAVEYLRKHYRPGMNAILHVTC